MSSNNTYPKSMMFYHLLGFLLVIAAYVTISMTDLFPRGSSLRGVAIQTHFLVGIILIMFFIPRFFIRVKKFKSIPPITPSLSKNNKILANLGHFALYAWMVIMPLLGWALVSANYGSVNIYGINIPGIIAQNKEIASLLKELHEVFAGLGMFLIIGHVVMALWHHFKKQNNTMIRMFPWFKWGMKKD
ncbi:MAG: cytochrome b [Candidatus Gracilibacteria bacterium]|nr:cytochrome b [Candidatus Gracilibacteria bacterium]